MFVEREAIIYVRLQGSRMFVEREGIIYVRLQRSRMFVKTASHHQSGEPTRSSYFQPKTPGQSCNNLYSLRCGIESPEAMPYLRLPGQSGIPNPGRLLNTAVSQPDELIYADIPNAMRA